MDTEEQIKILRANQSELAQGLQSLISVVVVAGRETINSNTTFQDMISDAQQTASRVVKRLEESSVDL